MTDLVVIVPSRGRPGAAAKLVEAFRSTCIGLTRLVFAVDDDDPTRAEYVDLTRGGFVDTLLLPSHTMVEALNQAASVQGVHSAYALGFMGDDHRPRSVGWDVAYLDTLRQLGTGFVYGNDLLQGPNIPTQVAMTSDIVRALGYMAPPTLRHMYVDNAWKALGEAIGRIRYLPDVVVEHMHPVAGKSEWTEGHVRVNDGAIYAADHAAFEAWRNGLDFTNAVAALRGLL